MMDYIDMVNGIERLIGDEDEYIPPVLFVPNVIDIEITGDCDYNCPNCWGTKPKDYCDELSVNQWIQIFENLNDLPDDFVSRVVITGGEALIRKDLGKLVSRLADMEKQVSLSTTGLDYHGQLEGIISKLSTIGLPIDGPSPEINALWRRHPSIKDGGLSMSLDALKLIQKVNPDLQTSVRTLVHQGNVDQIAQIPKFLEKSGIDISRLRWILYELNTRKTIIGDCDKRLVSTGSIASSRIGVEQFPVAIAEAGSKFKEVIIRTIGNIAGRNFIINPSGECRAVVESDIEGELIEKEFGNIHNNFDKVIELLNWDVETLGAFSISARSGPAYFYLMQDKGIDID